jgi:hypothetical protein
MTRRRQKKRARKDELPQEKRSRSLRKLGILLVSIVLLSASLAAGLLFSGLVTSGPSELKTAAIVDQLSLTQPNQDFVASATNILEQAGYRVDYFPGEEVTVHFYRDLPTHDYDLIILRVHAGISEETDLSTGEKTEKEYVSLFTGEPYSKGKYPQEEIGRLGKAEYYEGAPPLFGIGPDFITHSMRGSFDETLIIMMGCDGLRSQTTAQAFLDKGASAFVSWSRTVSASHTDTATELLLQKLLIDGLPVGDAVVQTAAEVGPDPVYGARLRVLPEAGPAD